MGKYKSVHIGEDMQNTMLEIKESSPEMRFWNLSKIHDKIFWEGAKKILLEQPKEIKTATKEENAPDSAKLLYFLTESLDNKLENESLYIIVWDKKRKRGIILFKNLSKKVIKPLNISYIKKIQR